MIGSYLVSTLGFAFGQYRMYVGPRIISGRSRGANPSLEGLLKGVIGECSQLFHERRVKYIEVQGWQ